MGWELKFVTDYDINQWCFVNKHTGKTISGMYNNSEFSLDRKRLKFESYLNTVLNKEINKSLSV